MTTDRRDALREAASATVMEWDRYVEAHAGRGHDGAHEPEKVLDGDCLRCAGAAYGTEVQMGEYTIPALRAALAADPPALDVFEACSVCGRVEQVTMRGDWQDAVTAGAAIPIVGCGNPWHYARLAREETP